MSFLSLDNNSTFIRYFMDIRDRLIARFIRPSVKSSKLENNSFLVILLSGLLTFSGDSFALGVEGYSSYRQTETIRANYKKEALRFAESALRHANIGSTDRTIDLAMQARENSRLVISDFTGPTSQRIHIKLRDAVSATKKGRMDQAAMFLEEAIVYLKKIQ